MVEPTAETTAKGTYSEDEVAAAIAIVLSEPPLDENALPKENAIRDLLMFLSDPPEPEAAEEAARMIVLIAEANGQS